MADRAMTGGSRKRTQDRRIEEITGAAGELFVYLKPGFAYADANKPGAQHCFGEDTRAAVAKTMRAVVPCACAECSRLLTAR
ncbi:MAG: hypothetical protein ACRYHQ_05450, partial [Janthinobacterium lividum]